ncbi:MAG: acetyltransferase [Cyanobacteriota bacterium]|nr:acetyltransferase [Cyanobacteriota bacterium]
MVSPVFLKVQDDNGFGIVEILDLKGLFDPFSLVVKGILHGGEELQDAQDYPKSDLIFPSGESLPRCWRHPEYQAS